MSNKDSEFVNYDALLIVCFIELNKTRDELKTNIYNNKFNFYFII